MSETIEESSIHKSPMDETHRRLGATFKGRDGWSVPASYTDASTEYTAVREDGAGLIDLSSRGRVEVSGSEAVLFLNGLITNDVKTLSENAWMPAVFPNAQGRILASVRVLRRNDSFLFDTEAATREQVVKTLSRFTMAGDFRVKDVTGETALLSVQGARARQLVQTVLGTEASEVERGRIVQTTWQDESLSIIRATHTSEDGFDLFTGADVAASVWEALIDAGARAVGFDAFEILRIEAGEPRYGVDMDETRVVLETGLDHAVSFTKGCYIGQEIIARIHWRGHVAKRLAGLVLETDGAVERDDRIKTPDGKEIGQITSATFSPRRGRAIALGYVKYDYLSPGTSLRIASNDAERKAHIAELPFVRGSWYAKEEQTV